MIVLGNLGRKMRKCKAFLIVILVAILAVVLSSCALSAKDCYVFGDDEFKELWKEDNSKLDERPVALCRQMYWCILRIGAASL